MNYACPVYRKILCFLFIYTFGQCQMEVLTIRHGRARIRHSSEKDHIKWGLKAFDNLTLDYDFDSFEQNETNYDNFNGNTTLYTGNFSTEIDFTKLDLDYVNYLKSYHKHERNDSPTNQLKSSSSSSSQSTTSDSPILRLTNPTGNVLQQSAAKPLKKKKIMENIKKDVDKGLEYIKAHSNLSENYVDIGLNRNNNFTSTRNQQNNLNFSGSPNNLLNHAVIPTTTTIIATPSTSTSLKPTKPSFLSTLSTESTETVKHNDNSNLKLKKIEKLRKVQNYVNILISQTNGSDINTNKSFKTNNSHLNVMNNNNKHINFTNINDNYNNNSEKDFGYNNNINNNDEYPTLTSNSDDSTLENSDYSNNDGIIEIINRNDYEMLDDIEDDQAIFHIDHIELADWDETSRNNRINLMKGRDVVTRFLQIVETQHLLGANCTAGTALNLGDGVVDRYAQDRFRIEAEVAVNRANMLTRIFKTTAPAVQSSEHLLHASVLSMVEFDDDIFAAGNCFDWNQHPVKKGLFCPFAYRLPAPDQGASLAKDLAAEYHYLGNTSEWFFLARKNAERVIAQNEQYIKAFHIYSTNNSTRSADEILSVKYEDGRWSKPYYDCGGGNIWMLTYTVPFFGYKNGTYFFKGTSGIDIDLRRVDIDQCPQRNLGSSQPLNIFAGTDKCKHRTTECRALSGLGFRRGSYKCVCRRGFYFPDINLPLKYFNGSTLEEEYEKFMLGEPTIYNHHKTFECLPCAEGCDHCMDHSPCIAALNWPMRTGILVLACAIIGLLPPAVLFTFKYQRVKVVRAASPALLRVISLGALLIYLTTIVMYPPPSIYTCIAKIWLREIGFSLTYGALMLKTWRISVIFRIRSAKAVKITDSSLLKRLGMLCCVVGIALLVRTIVAPPVVVVGRTKEDLKAFLCKTDWWDHTFTSMEVLFLAWGVRLCMMVRKAPSEFNESRFISMAIYNEFLLTCFLNVSMLFLQSPANPDLLYIIFFCHTQLTVTLLLALIFGSKVYMVFRGSGKPTDDSLVGVKSSGTKYLCRSQARPLANPSTATSSTVQWGGNCATEIRLSEDEAMDEINQFRTQLSHLQDRVPPKGAAGAIISALLELFKSPDLTDLKMVITAKLLEAKLIKHDKAINTDNDWKDECEPSITAIQTHTEQACISKVQNSPNNTNLDFDDLELECMCNNNEICEHVDNAEAKTPNARTLKFNKTIKISCKRCLNNLGKINKNFQTLLNKEDDGKNNFEIIVNYQKIQQNNENELLCDNKCASTSSKKTITATSSSAAAPSISNLHNLNNNSNFINNVYNKTILVNELDSLDDLNRKKIDKKTLHLNLTNENLPQQKENEEKSPKMPLYLQSTNEKENFKRTPVTTPTTTAETLKDNGDDEKNQSCSANNFLGNDSSSIINNSTTTTTKSSSNDSKIVLDLNDTSKFTKEVSV